MGTNTSRSVSGLTAGTTYYYRVRAYNANGNSGNSNIVTVTTSSSTAQGLANGQVVTGLSGAAGSERRYYIDVPAGATRLTVTLSGGAGDADLYLRFDSPPARSAYGCGSEKADSNEECLVSNPSEGRHYILVYGYRDYSGISIKAEYLESTPGAPEPLNNGELRSNLNGTAGSERHFYIDVPAGATGLKIEMAGGTGDADLYVRFSSAPTLAEFDCRPYVLGNDEECEGTNPPTGRYYIMVRGDSAYAGVSLKAEYRGVVLPPGPEPLSNGELRSNLDGTAGSERHFYIDVPAGATGLKIEMAGGTGDADLYFRLGSAPTLTEFDCRPFKFGNNEVCEGTNPAAGRYYIMVRGDSAYAGVSLKAEYRGVAPPPGSEPLNNGELRGNLDGAAGSERHFYIDVPAGATGLKIEMADGTGDADLYVRFGSAPTLTEFDCRPYVLGNDEECEGTNPAAGRYYILVHGYESYSGLALWAEHTSTPPVTTYPLTVGKTGNGIGTVTSTPAGIACGTDCEENYSAGSTVILMADPAAGSTFAGWGGACSGTSTCSLTMTAAKAVVATFNLAPATQADLVVSQSDNPDPATVDSDLVYTVTINNLGTSIATGLVLTDTVPTGVAGVRCTNCGTCTFSNSVLNCPLQDLAAGASHTWRLTVTPKSAGSLTNQVNIASATPDPNMANNAASEMTTVNPKRVPGSVDHDFAVTEIKAPAKIKLKPFAAVAKTVKVTLQNRSRHIETITGAAMLAELVDLHVDSLGECLSPQVELITAPLLKRLPIRLRPKQKLTVGYKVTFDCTNDPIATTKKNPGHDDYRYSARVDHHAIDGNPDAHPDDDVCPRSVAAPYFDNFPNDSIKEKGCGRKLGKGLLGGEIITDLRVPIR
ncbi:MULTISPECIES: pre-peptidase C-terminal domain-containing protein [Methylomicrobium]|uniref:pre-peptidase C-terminal domain-containing protein n=1 Tax=Methylomicrobium TaxID=39773 RepID=UPI0004DF7EB7|nr:MULTISPECIES: pre-peptidase C-terminal domain-containing protein [Methylomicrobium]